MAVKQGGLSLIELMIAMLLALVLLGVVLTAFRVMHSTAIQTRQLAFLQQNGQLVLNLLHNELQNSGFWGGQSLQHIRQAAVTGNQPMPDCVAADIDSGSFPQPNQPFINVYAAVSTGGRQLNCLNDLLPATEFIQVKRNIGEAVAPHSLRSNRFYLQTDWQQSRFVTQDNVDDDAKYVYPYQHVVLYLQQQQQQGQSVPVLMRKRLVRTAAGVPRMATDSVIDGVERLHFEFLIDSNLDGRPNYTLATREMTTAHWLQHDHRIVAVQFYVLLRTIEPDFRYRNTQQYQLGSVNFFAANDHYRRLLLSGAVYFENAVLADL